METEEQSPLCYLDRSEHVREPGFLLETYNKEACSLLGQ